MNCPNCGTPEKARVKVCSECKEAYASMDLLELRQLEFLMKETASWDVTERLRFPYEERLHILQDRLKGLKLTKPEPEIEPVPSAPSEKLAPSILADKVVNIRSGPGPNYPLYKKLARGDTAEVIGVSPGGKWWVVSVPSSIAPDGRGWVSSVPTTAYNTEDVPVIQPLKVPS